MHKLSLGALLNAYAPPLKANIIKYARLSAYAKDEFPFSDETIGLSLADIAPPAEPAEDATGKGYTKEVVSTEKVVMTLAEKANKACRLQHSFSFTTKNTDA